jgi:type I restriction enzyme S subunit
MTYKSELIKLEKVLNFSNGKASPERNEKSMISVFGSNGLIGKASKANSTENTIVIGRVGSYCGSVHFSKEPCWVTDNAIKATAKDDNDPFFLFYLLKKLNLNNWHSGSGQPLLNQSTLNSIEALIPIPSEQRLISKFLLAIDERVALLQDENSTLEKIAKALFKSWFIDFDPVHANQEGRRLKDMDAAITKLFPSEFEHIDAGVIPKGWSMSTVGQSFVLTMGQSPPGSTYCEDDSEMPFYQGRTDFGFRFPTKRIYCTSPTRIAEIGDTLVSVRAPVGDVNMAIERCCIGRGVASVRHPKNYRSFTLYAIEGLKSYFRNFDGEGTIFGSINKTDFESLPIISPCSNVLAAYDEISGPIDEKIVENEKKIRVLSNLRDTLLPHLISGKIALSDTDTLSEAGAA